MNIQLPPKLNEQQPTTIEIGQLVVIGANGSGKTRFGSRIEEQYNRQAHRISAQKSLSMPQEVSPKSRERAQSEFLYGNYHSHYDANTQSAQKISHRWGGKWSTYLLNDYEKLMVLLHTEEFEDSLAYKEGRIEKPTTKLDRIQEIWQEILPHRTLIKKAGIIEAQPVGEQNTYNASELSDGERVIFYLIGEVICAPNDCIIIIDEPEMHIHKSLVKKLFDLIENERPDCAFVYLTHDIDFAFSRQNAKKVWAKSYAGNNIWDYEILDEVMPMPEQLYLEILGSRREVIFLEGDESSIDYKLYEQVFPNYTIKPLGGCEKVINSVKAFNDLNGFHHITSFGIIDRDRRLDDEVQRLNERNIRVLDVAEAENLLLLEPIVRTVAIHMHADPNAVFTEVRNNLIAFFTAQLEAQIILHYKHVLSKKFAELVNFREQTIQEAIPAIDTSWATIDKQQVYDTIRQTFDNVIATQDYEGVLRLFNLKNALIPRSRVCELTGVRNKESYLSLVVSLMKKNDATAHTIIQSINDKILRAP